MLCDIIVTIFEMNIYCDHEGKEIGKGRICPKTNINKCIKIWREDVSGTLDAQQENIKLSYVSLSQPTISYSFFSPSCMSQILFLNFHFSSKSPFRTNNRH